MKPTNMPHNLFVSRVLGGTLKTPPGRVVACVARLEGSLEWWLYCNFFYDGREQTERDVIVERSPYDLAKTVADAREALDTAIGYASGSGVRELVVESNEEKLIDQRFLALFAEVLPS